MGDYWGFNFFLREFVRLPRFSGWSEPVMNGFHRAGLWIALVAAATTLYILRRRRSSGRVTLAAVVSMFLIFIPRLPIGLAILPLPLLLVVDPLIGVTFVICAGLAVMFSCILSGERDPAPGPLFAVLAWATLIAFVWKSVRPRTSIASRIPARALLIIAILGLLAREVIAWFSIGSADATTMQYIARSIEAGGLMNLYRRDASLTNTPLTAYWCVLCDFVARFTHLPFPFVLKQLTVACDAIACVLLARIWRDRSGSQPGALAIAAAYAWCPLAMLLSAYHGNFDPIYALLALLAAYAIDRHDAWFIGGVCLGAAIDIKLIPILLVPMLVAVCPDRRRLARFLAGLAIMSIQYVGLFFVARETYLHNIVRYQSQIDKWGLMFILSEASRQPRCSAVMQMMMYTFFDRGRFVLLAAIVLAAIRARRIRLTALESAACGAAIFFILTPGFAVQYLIFVLPLLFATRPVSAIVFGITAGLMALFFYWMNWTGGLPFDSTGIGTTPRAPGPQFGLLAWATLVAFVWTTLQLKLSNDVPRFFSLPRSAARP